jgi:dTDP-4-dehydrorhamnose reductase
MGNALEMKKKKVAVLGGKGMLGRDLVGKLAERSSFEVGAFDLPDFDITKESDVEEVVAASELVINCAAYTDVDRAEEEPEKAFAVNASAVGIIGKIASRHRVYVLHVSTDFIFDGSSDKPYKEDDMPNPLNVYGASKLLGEKNLIGSGCSYCIMRVEWSYGSGGKNFIKKIIEKSSLLNQPIKVVSDQVGSPTWTSDMADAILCLIQNKPLNAVFHFAADGFASRFDVAQFILNKLHISNMVLPCKSSDFPVKARRPLNSCFNTTKIQSLLPYKIPHWQTSLDKFLENSVHQA